jgi:quercetin dioxygenase-like cupin family protein
MTKYGSSGVDFGAVLTRSPDQSVSVGFFHFDADGVVGEHVAPSWQLLVVISGLVRVSAGPEVLSLASGDAVEWSPGEAHESRAVEESTVLVLQSGESLLAPE